MPRSHTLRIPTRDPGIVHEHIRAHGRAHRPAYGVASQPRKRPQEAHTTAPIRKNVPTARTGQPKNEAFYTEKRTVPGAAPTAPGMTPLPLKKEVRIYG